MLTEENAPNLIEIARKGMYSNRTFINGTPTPYSLTPILDGVYPLDRGICPIPRKDGKLAGKLREVGYKTFGFNSYNNYAFFENIGFFDRFEGRTGNGSPDDLTERVMSHVRDTFAQLHARHPLFYWIHLMDVHYPYYPRTDEYAKEDQEYLKNYFKHYDGMVQETFRKYVPKGDFATFLREIYRLRLDDQDKLVSIAQRMYRRAIAKVDEKISELVDSVEQLIDGEYLFIVTSDHGEVFFEEGSPYWIHDPFFHNDFINRVPMILYGTGIERRDLNGTLTTSLDIMPTVLDFVGYDGDLSEFQGISLLGRELRRERVVFCESLFASCRFSPSDSYGKRLEDLKMLISAVDLRDEPVTVLESYELDVPFSYERHDPDLAAQIERRMRRYRSRARLSGILRESGHKPSLNQPV